MKEKYIVGICSKCGMTNILKEKYSDGNGCEICGEYLAKKGFIELEDIDKMYDSYISAFKYRGKAMSKLYIQLSYKNCCILKHKLRDSIKETENIIIPRYQYSINHQYKGYTDEKLKEIKKELEEEKRALAAITEEMIIATCHYGESWYKPNVKEH